MGKIIYYTYGSADKKAVNYLGEQFLKANISLNGWGLNDPNLIYYAEGGGKIHTIEWKLQPILADLMIRNGFDIKDVKFSRFKPFTEVLVRDSNEGTWKPKHFARYIIDTDYPYTTTDNCSYRECIPYKGNEHLIFTNNDA